MLVRAYVMSELEKYTYYRIIPIGGHSDAILLEKHDPHKNVLKGFISLRRVRRGPQISIPMPLRMSTWFAEHNDLLQYFPDRVLVIIPFNIDNVTDIDVLMDIAKALYGFKDARELYREKIRAGKIKPVEAGLDPHYRLFLNAKTFTKIPINTLYDMLREASSEEVEDSTP
jgi:hypothetical protein